MPYRYHQSSNIYSKQLAEEFKTAYTNFQILQGKISTIISDSDLKKYADQSSTWYSAFSTVVQTVEGISETVSQHTTKIAEDGETIEQMTSKLAEYKRTIDENSSHISSIEENYATTEAVSSSITQKADEITLAVSKVYMTNAYLEYAVGDDATDPPTTGWSQGTPQWTAGKYIWQRTVKVIDGEERISNVCCIQGAKGTDATAYSLTVSCAAVVKDEDGNYDPSSITLTAKYQTGDGPLNPYSGRFKIETTSGSGWTAPYSSTSNESSTTYTIPAGITALRCSLYKGGGFTTLLDQQTVPIVEDGLTGENGADAYTVVLSNESHTFAASNNAAVAGSTDCNIIAYKGTTQMAATIGNITGLPEAGMSVSITDNGKTNAKFTVTVTTDLTTLNGVLNIPITVDGVSFTKKFTYSLARKGDNGRGITGVTEYYAINNSTSSAPADSEFGTTVKTPTEAKPYLWNYEVIAYTSGDPTKTNKKIISKYSKDGRGITSITNY